MSLANRAVCCGLTFALAFGGVSTLAFADPQSDLAAAQERLSSLGNDLATVQGELSDLSAQLEATDNEMDRTQESIDQTQVELTAARSLLSQHVRSGYKTGGFDALEFVLSSSSLEDLVSRFYYMRKVNESEVAQITQVNALEEELQTQLGALTEQRDAQAARVSEAEGKVAEYQSLVEEARAYYNELDAQVQAELAAAAAAEAAAQAEAEAANAGIATAVAAIEETSSTSETSEQTQTETPAPQEETQQETYVEEPQQQETPSVDYGSDPYPGGGVASAYSCLGWPYVWGGYGPWNGGFDCSGLVSYCFGDGSWRRGCESLAWAIQDAGLWKYGMENLSYGDLLFTDSEYNHVGIYIGGGMMIHAPTFGRTVSIDPVWSCYGGGPFVMP